MAAKRRNNIQPGHPLFLGANRLAEGYNFAVEAPEDASVSLLLYRGRGKAPAEELPLTKEFCTGRIYSVLLKGFRPEGFQYNFQINGRVLPDPCAYRIFGRERFGAPIDPDPHKIRCGFLPEKEFDWEGDRMPELAYEDMILYKLHVRGYTRQWKGTGPKKGTFESLIGMIPYWKELGINAIELMPAYEFPEVSPHTPHTGMVTSRRPAGLVNYWGYLSGFYFAPKSAYAATSDPEEEVCRLVRALHQAGIACIMEMYFPAGTNRFTALRALQFWRGYYHIDGFHLVGEGAPLHLALHDGVLFGTKLFAHGYDLGAIRKEAMPKVKSFGEYNDGFCRDMRRFLKSDEGMVLSARYRMTRSHKDQGVINYMACQDGFTLGDMVAYNYKHNEANGEDNQDGSSYNDSWNCGAEGPSRRTLVRQLRMKQMKNAFALLLLSQGTPMIYGGDEIANSQGGNNNAYCQDNPIGWVDWKGLKKNQELRTFVKELIAFRKAHPILHGRKPLLEADYEAKGFPDVSFHGERAWYCSSENTSRMLGIMYNGAYEKNQEGDPDNAIYIACNFYWEERVFALPNLPEGMHWIKEIDTAGSFSQEERYKKDIGVGPRSIVVLLGRREEPGSEEKESSGQEAAAGEEPQEKKLPGREETAGKEPGEEKKKLPLQEEKDGQAQGSEVEKDAPVAAL